MAETDDQRADRLASLAMEWADRIRTEPVDGLAAELLNPLPRDDLYGLIGLLGGAADPTVPTSIWWGWVRYGVTAVTADPIRWDGPEEPDDDPVVAGARRGQPKGGPDVVDQRVLELDRLGRTARQIGDEMGMTRAAAASRLRRARHRYGPAQPAREAA